MSKAFWVTVRKKVEWCDSAECPHASDIRLVRGHRTINCGALGKRIGWSSTEAFPTRCPRGNKRHNQSTDRRKR